MRGACPHPRFPEPQRAGEVYVCSGWNRCPLGLQEDKLPKPRPGQSPGEDCHPSSLPSMACTGWPRVAGHGPSGAGVRHAQALVVAPGPCRQPALAHRIGPQPWAQVMPSGRQHQGAPRASLRTAVPRAHFLLKSPKPGLPKEAAQEVPWNPSHYRAARSWLLVVLRSGPGSQLSREWPQRGQAWCPKAQRWPGT